MMPNFHKVHHEQDQFYTDSNYGTLFIIWDRIFGTFKIKPVSEINYGLKEFEGNRNGGGKCGIRRGGKRGIRR